MINFLYQHIPCSFDKNAVSNSERHNNNDENNNDNLIKYLSDANPFMREGENSVDVLVYDDFKKKCEKFDYLDDYSKEIGGQYEENFKKYFIDGYYFYSNVDNPNVTGYVTKLLGQPVMFLGSTNQELGTFIHEFGHYFFARIFGVWVEKF